MNLKKTLPVIFLIVLAVVALLIKNCNTRSPATNKKSTTSSSRPSQNTRQSNPDKEVDFDRNTTDIFYTKHAKCRMKCREITQKEVKEILTAGIVNYNKSNLQAPKGPTYAVEGVTSDRQHVRIIFAPHQQHLSVVTVIDLDDDYDCNCN